MVKCIPFFLMWEDESMFGTISTLKTVISLIIIQSLCNRVNYQRCILSFINTSVVVETISETSHLCWNNETIRFKSSLTSIIIESTYLTLNMNKIWGCFKVQVGWKNAFYGETGSRKGLEKVSARPGPWKNIFNLHFKCQQNNTLPVFNVQIIRLYSLGSWNVYVPDNFQT